MSSPDSALSTFADLGLPETLVRALERGGITTPTPVQSAVVPDAMSGHDVLGRARTGSGKTLAFGLPILARLAGERSRPKHPRALIIVPTRELATQVRRSLEPLAHAMRLKLTTVYGGTAYDKQIKQLRAGADIVVATPGRLQDLMDKGHCRTDDIAVTVLDEADHLCDLGFYPAVDALLSQTPATGQRLLLSATLDGDVDRLVRTHLREPLHHELDAGRGDVTTMDHHVMVVGGFRDKVEAATALIEANPRSIVFTRTREGATELAEAFGEQGIEAVDLHGNLSQRVRERNLHKFSTGKAQVVVATDVAARGIHVDHVGMVVHFDAPTDQKAYLHRSGRTARAGESGAVVTITTRRQVDELARMQSRAGVKPRHHDIRTAPRPMTAEALADSGEAAPAPSTRGGSAPRGGRPRQGGPRRDRDDRPRSARPRSEQPYRSRDERPVRDEPAYRSRDERPVRDRDERPYRSRDERPVRSRDDRPARSRDDRPARDGSRPASSDRRQAPSRKTGKKSRWTTSDKKRGARR